MAGRISKILKGKYVIIYFIILFSTLFILYRPTFSNPPRSDYWPAFYFFHLVDSPSSPPSCFHILTYDPWGHGTYRPLSFLILYLEYRLFGTNFIGNHLVTFFFYFLSIILLYRLAMNFNLDRIFSLILLGVYAFLFSHFDIVAWTFHLYCILGFCAFLAGFNCYISFLKSGNKLILIPAGLYFLLGMLCYEVFAPWPLAILILTYSPHLFRKHQFKKGALLSRSLSLLGGIYLIYIIVLLLSRSIGSYQVGPMIGVRHPIVIRSLILSAFSVFFNLVYTQISVNLYPLLAIPALVKDNLDMGGLLINWFEKLDGIVILGGGATFILLVGLGISLFKRRRLRLLSLLFFFAFLLFCFFFIVSLARSITNPLIYPFIQFRYQYIPNALTALMVVVVLDAFFRSSRRAKIIVCVALIPVLIVNLYISSRCISILRMQLEPLRTVLSNIKTGIKRGLINSREKLYIEREITGNLPHLCWNDDMALFMEGTYEWVFSKKEIEFFTLNPQNATWIIRANNYRNIERKD